MGEGLVAIRKVPKVEPHRQKQTGSHSCLRLISRQQRRRMTALSRADRMVEMARAWAIGRKRGIMAIMMMAKPKPVTDCSREEKADMQPKNTVSSIGIGPFFWDISIISGMWGNCNRSDERFLYSSRKNKKDVFP